MKLDLSKCGPVFIITLAMGLSACGKNDAPQTGGGAAAAPALKAQTVATAFQADCGGETAAAAAVNAAFDVTQCQLGADQLALVQQLGPFEVDADCVHKSLEIKSASGDVSGSGAINDDGTYSVPLVVSDQFGGADACPVKLEGTATGKVACSADGKVTSVDVNTVFNLASVPAETTDSTGGDTGASRVDAVVAAAQPASATAIEPGNAPDHGRDGDRDHERDRDHEGKQANAGKAKGKVEIKPVPKGEVGKQGKQSGGVWASQAPASRVNACVNFAPCGFSSNATLSCAAPAAPASSPAAGETPAAPAPTPAPAGSR